MPKHRNRKVQKSLFNYFSKTNPTNTAKEESSMISRNLKDLSIVKNDDETKAAEDLSPFNTTSVNESRKENESSVEDLAAAVTVESSHDQDVVKPTDIENVTMAETEADNDEEEEEEKLLNIHHRKKKRRIMDDDEDEDDMLGKANKRKPGQVLEEKESEEEHDISEEEESVQYLRKKKRHITEESEEEEDFKEDLNFLDKTDILKKRTRGKQVSQYTEALQKLKDKKGKLAEYDKTDKGPIESYTIMLDSDGSSEEEENDDFIVDDDIIDGEKVSIQKVELPAEFSKGRALSFKKQLETYILYLIELVLNPVFDIKSHSKYEIAKEAVLKRIQSYRDSIVTSDVWLPSFKEAVDKYSNWHIARPFIADDFIFCEACRSNKPATIQVQLSSDTIPTTEWIYLGSECCRKGEMYHQLNHFSSHMYTQVSQLVNKMKRTDRGQSIDIFSKLENSGDIKKLTNKVNRLFNDIVMVYNMRGQKSRVEFDSSDDDETD